MVRKIGMSYFRIVAHRSAPRSKTGLAPYEVLFGRNVQGLLGILQSGWRDGDMTKKAMVTWVTELASFRGDHEGERDSSRGIQDTIGRLHLQTSSLVTWSC